ncbi:hypothetical protein PG987_015630 [Apiospora arundinis]
MITTTSKPKTKKKTSFLRPAPGDPPPDLRLGPRRAVHRPAPARRRQHQLGPAPAVVARDAPARAPRRGSPQRRPPPDDHVLRGPGGAAAREYSIVGGFRDEFRLVCGDQPAWLASTISGFKIVVSQGPGAPRHLSLMRTCRAVYGELFERLYGQNTVSLCGQGMLDWISREWPLAGLARVRYVHAALLVDAAWGRKRQRQSLEKAVQTLRETLPGMRQLDLEIAVWSGEHKPAGGGGDADWFWACLCGILAQYLTPTAQTATTKGGRREKGGARSSPPTTAARGVRAESIYSLQKGECRNQFNGTWS